MPGPWVQAAAFCDKVLQEADGVLSLIRLVDRIVISAQSPEGAELPAELPEGGALTTTFVVMMKADDAQGRHPVTIRIQQPSGTYLEDKTVDVMFEGNDRGVNLVLNIQVPAIEGLYWFEVYINDTLVTRAPLRVMYQRIPSGA